MSGSEPFEGIRPELGELLRRRGISAPTEIQRRALPAILHGTEDLLLVAPTGTGKTEAALLPLLSRLRPEGGPGIRLLYVTPLRALNRDLEHRFREFGQALHLTAAVRHGDTPPAERSRQSRRPPDLLLTTPETLQLLLVGRNLRRGLAALDAVVVDEIHELVPSDRGAQLAVSLERLDHLVGRRLRRIGLSATVRNPEAVAEFLAPPPRRRRVVVARGPRALALEVRTAVADRSPDAAGAASELQADPEYFAAIRAVAEEIRGHRATLVFVNTRPTAEGLGARLLRLAPDLPIAVHHGSLAREAREESETAFREGRLSGLVATSSLELGLDLGKVDLVVQFGSPHQAGRLLQRIGRSGHRFDRTVRGVLVALDEEDLEEAAVIARRALAREIEPTVFRPRNRLAVAQQVLSSLRASGAQELRPLIEELRGAVPARDLDPAEWEELIGFLGSLGTLAREGGRIRPTRGTLARFYATLSLIPDRKSYRLRDIATRRAIGTLDERFVVTQILAEPELLFLLFGRTWRVVEFRDGELLVEAVSEIGREPRWVGEDLPVPFEAAEEIGRIRRTGGLEGYPLAPEARALLAARVERCRAEGVGDDTAISVTANGRILLLGACFGSRTNATLALAFARAFSDRLGARTEILGTEPTWILLGLPVALAPATVREILAVSPEELAGRMAGELPATLEYRYVFLTVARKFGVLPVEADPRALRDLEPLIRSLAATPLGREVLEKTLHERFDLPHAREVLERIRSGDLALRSVPAGSVADLPVARLRWRELPDLPPPTLLAAVGERLRDEELVLVCLRCGFSRSITARRYAAEGGAACRLCHGALSAVLSPRRTEEIDRLVAYAKRKWRGRGGPPRRRDVALEPLVRAAYTSAELLALHGTRTLLTLAARGVGPETARRLLARPYRDDGELLTELLRAERKYARTRSFWD